MVPNVVNCYLDHEDQWRDDIAQHILAGWQRNILNINVTVVDKSLLKIDVEAPALGLALLEESTILT